MIKQFAGVTLWSEDHNNLLPFYRDILGLNVTMESEGNVAFGDDSEEAPWFGLGTHSEVRGRNNDPARHMVGFMSDDIHADWQRLKDAGVEFIEDPTDYGDSMYIATFKDPDGNFVQLFQYGGSEQ